MAIVFEFCIECGPDKAQCDLVGQHFSQLALDLLTGTHCEVVSHLTQDNEQNWWCELNPSNLSSWGARTLQDAIEMSEVGLRLYQRLLAAPPFRFALSGFNVGGIWPLSEWRDWIDTYQDGTKVLEWSGLVMREDVWQELGSPKSVYVPTWSRFREGYIWQAYSGESYRPVGGADKFGRELYALRQAIVEH